MCVYSSFCRFSHIVSSHNIVFQSYLGQLPSSPFSEIMWYICNIIRFIYCRLHSVLVPQSFWLVLFLSLHMVEYIHFCVQFFGFCKWRESGVCHQMCWAALFTKNGLCVLFVVTSSTYTDFWQPLICFPPVFCLSRRSYMWSHTVLNLWGLTFFFYFWPFGSMWDLSFPNRGQTKALCSGSVES